MIYEKEMIWKRPFQLSLRTDCSNEFALKCYCFVILLKYFLSVLETRSCHDVREVLENLKLKAVEKIRAYLLEQISRFRKPMTNYQVPQNAMLKFK